MLAMVTCASAKGSFVSRSSSRLYSWIKTLKARKCSDFSPYRVNLDVVSHVIRKPQSSSAAFMLSVALAWYLFTSLASHSLKAARGRSATTSGTRCASSITRLPPGSNALVLSALVVRKIRVWALTGSSSQQTRVCLEYIASPVGYATTGTHQPQTRRAEDSSP